MDDIEKFSKGLFHADCGVIQLLREGTYPIHVQGPGHISQDNNKNLTFLIHVGTEQVVALIKEIDRPQQVGTIVPLEDYLTFTAQTYGGEIWKSAIPGVSINPGLGGGVVSGALHKMENTIALTTEREKDDARLVVRDFFVFPETHFTQTQIEREGQTKINTARDSAIFTVGDEKFVLSRKETTTELRCTIEKSGVAKFKHMRIQEAIQFALGQLFEPCAVETYSGRICQKIFRSVGMQEKPAQQHPPLEFRGRSFNPEVYEIAKAYYSKILNHTTEEWHELSAHVYFLVQAGGSAIELQCLAIGVCAEAVAGSCFPNLAAINDVFSKEIDKLQGQLRELGLSEQLLKRVAGTVGVMKDPRNADKLRAFVQENGFDMRLFKSWQGLRNSAAHGSKIKDKDIVKTLASLRDVLYLCYAMVLRYCGYTGIRTDYSTPGAPEITHGEPKTP